MKFDSARREFHQDKEKSAQQHIVSVAKVMGLKKQADHEKQESRNLDESFQRLEKEWTEKRKDLFENRKSLQSLNMDRLSSLVKQFEEASAEHSVSPAKVDFILNKH